MPDDVVGLAGALLEHLCLDTFQDDAGVGAGALADTGLDALVVAGDQFTSHLNQMLRGFSRI